MEIPHLSPKFIFAIVSSLIGIIAYWPYLKDIFAGKTKPHAYTWLIWLITQGTATAGLLVGGGGFAALSLGSVLILILTVFLLSFKYGTRNITKGDTFVLILSLAAIIVWKLLSNPFLAVGMVTAIDFFGYWPTFRKSLGNPWSESIISWWLFAFAGIFAVLAIEHYNFLTCTYISMTVLANAGVAMLCVLRRRIILKPE